VTVTGAAVGETVGDVVADLERDEEDADVDCVDVEDEIGLLELRGELEVGMDVELDDGMVFEVVVDLEVVDGGKKPTVESTLPI